MSERTLAIIKPDAVKKNAIGDIINRYEKAGLKPVAMRLMHLSKTTAQGFYAVHKARPFFDSLCTFMSSGPCVVLVLQGDNWASISPRAWRVLLERQQQLLTVALMLERSGQPMTRVPAELAVAHQSTVAIADVLHGAKLPMPAADRTGFELPSGALPESSLRRH